MRKQLEFRRVVLTETAFRNIRSETLRYRVRETGGVLVGYVDAKLSVVIVDASGPGARAERKLHSVLIDGKAATVFCQQWSSKTRGRVDYLGDWHSHVSFSTRSSDVDLHAMKIMENHTQTLCFAPISLIISRFSLCYEVFVLRNERLVTLQSVKVPDSFVKQDWIWV